MVTPKPDDLITSVMGKVDAEDLMAMRSYDPSSNIENKLDETLSLLNEILSLLKPSIIYIPNNLEVIKWRQKLKS